MTNSPPRTTYEHRPVGAKGQWRRKIILQQLEKVVEARIPWRQISIPRLTDEAGCSPATFYQYWTSLESAASEILRKKHAELEEDQKLPKRWLAIEMLLETEDWT